MNEKSSLSGEIVVVYVVLCSIKFDLLEEFGVNLTVHMDPIQTDNEEVNKLRKIVTETIYGIDPILNIHDFRVVFGPTHTNILFDIVIPYKFKMSLNEILGVVREAIDDGKTVYNFVVEVDRNFVKVGE